MLSDVFNNLEILNTSLMLVIMLLQDNNIFKNDQRENGFIGGMPR